MKLPEGFYNVGGDEFAGGVELAFMSTSLDVNVAAEYAMRGTTKACTIFEIPFDAASRGATVQWVSQVQSCYHYQLVTLLSKLLSSTLLSLLSSSLSTSLSLVSL